MHSISQFLAQQTPPGQDRLLVRRSFGKLFIIVADGAGGRSGGAEAADLVISLIESRLGDLSSEQACASVLREIDKEVTRDPVAGETTTVMTVIDLESVYGASVGDSGALLFNSDSIIELTQHQIRKPFVGSGAAVPIGFSRRFSHETLLVASDGLLKYTSREAIQTLICKTVLDDMAQSVARLVRLRSGGFPDDISIAVIRLES